MTTLKGSEKQIQWAERIRNDWLGESGIKKMTNLFNALKPIIKPELQEKAKDMIFKMGEIEDASWWIDNKLDLECHSGNYESSNKINAKSLFQEIVKKLGKK